MWGGDHQNSSDDEGSFPARKLQLGSSMTGGVEGSRMCIQRGVECSSPVRLVVYRLLTVVRKCRGRKRAAVEERESKQSRGRSRMREKVDVVGGVDDHRLESPVGVSENRSRNRASGCQRQEMTFNLAAGLGLLSLIAASKTELDKAMELRREMEVFLMSIREGHRSNASSTKPSDPRVAYAVSTTFDGLSNVSPYSLEDHAPSLSQPESGISLVYDKHCEMDEGEVPVEGLNHLEEELAAELEHLRVDEEKGESSENHEAAQKFILQIYPTYTAAQSITVSSGEVIDPQDAGIPEYYGVPPLELERRLHELLEARQEERIKELENHLECMKKRFQEKEVEVTWWKDTARLISKQVTEPSRLLR
ncbi:hypothetical protein Cgig2_002127 [Carnegiea gigantea]|uniref:Thioredoxin domain-containing protein n=1 Tax=Carnegiea gigantea TaxID=171969 RepID=A0A9Q1KVS8_9CARY|nr:hypothetical protein Cgig2_002127 [Carnegiea gigantea]